MRSRGIFWSLVCAIRKHDWHYRDYKDHRWGDVKSCRCARCDQERPHAWLPLERPGDSVCRKCSWCGTTDRHDDVSVALSPGHSPCLKSVKVCRRCAWRTEYVRHEFTHWQRHGATIGSGAWREHRCEVCGFVERQQYVMCEECKGTGICPRCNGRGSDPQGRGCDLCGGAGDCNCKFNNWIQGNPPAARIP